MNFLKTLGLILAKGLQVAGVVMGLLPALGSKAQAAVQGPLQTGINDLTAIGGVVVSVQTFMGARPGPERLAAAAPVIANIVRTSELVSGHDVGDEAEFLAGTTDLTNAVVRILGSLKADKIKVVGGDKNPPVPAAPAAPTPVIPIAPPATPPTPGPVAPAQ